LIIVQKIWLKIISKPCSNPVKPSRIAKDKSNPMPGLRAYRISCSCGKSYIGQTGRSFKSYLKYHIAKIAHNRISKSIISKLSFKSKHLICFYQTKILASTPYYFSRLIEEYLELEKHLNNFNHEDGYKLSQYWKPTIHHLNH
jgi:hypothetical protein